MPALELRVAETIPHTPATRLRGLLEKPNAVVLRRNHAVQLEEGDHAGLHDRLRVSCVLAVDITNPPEANASQPTVHAEGEELLEPHEEKDEFANSFAKGIEIFIASEKLTALVFADFDELSGALSLFDAYARIARYQPAYLRLDQRSIGIGYGFREGLVLGLTGDLQDLHESAAGVFDSVSSLNELDDSRTGRLTVRLPHAAIGYLHGLLRASSEWLNENSYKNILGS
jgi:hypothetical protein